VWLLRAALHTAQHIGRLLSARLCLACRRSKGAGHGVGCKAAFWSFDLRLHIGLYGMSEKVAAASTKVDVCGVVCVCVFSETCLSDDVPQSLGFICLDLFAAAPAAFNCTDKMRVCVLRHMLLKCVHGSLGRVMGPRQTPLSNACFLQGCPEHFTLHFLVMAGQGLQSHTG
jgi:hypothetical protein